MVPGLGTNKLKEGLHTDAHPCGRRGSQEWLSPVSVPVGELQLPLGTLGRPLTLTHRSGSASYEIAAFTLGPSAREILSAPFMSEVSLAPSPVGLLKLSPAVLQRQMQ